MTNSAISDQSVIDKSMRSVFVGNIPYEATEENLKDIFSEVGPVLSFKLVYDRETGKPKGYGFCEYKDQETALSAMRNLNSYEIGGRTLRVDNACTEKSRMEMQNLLQGQNTENPYGEAVQADKAPEAISKAVASLPPEQMFELMKQMKLCIQNNPNEARTMLMQNPQLAYALLQAQVVMRIIDPNTAVSMLHKANPIPPVLQPTDKANIVPAVPKIEEPWAPSIRPPLVSNPPPLIPNLAAFKNSITNSTASSTRLQDIDLRTMDRPIDPRIARMDQDLRTIPPPLQPPPSIPQIVPPPADNRNSISLTTLPESGFSRDPRADRFSRDPRVPVDPRIAKANTQLGNSLAIGAAALSGTGITPTSARLMAGMSPAGNIPSGASDQEKAALIMQVLQLSDEQIAMLPPEQRQSILVLKEQIAKSAR